MSKAAAKAKLMLRDVSIADNDIFLSSEFAGYLSSKFAGIASAAGMKRVQFRIVNEPLSTCPAAFTDGEKVTINLAAPYIEAMETREEKLEIIFGLAAHEVGHVLGTDFKIMKAQHDALKLPTWYPSVDTEDADFAAKDLKARTWIHTHKAKAKAAEKCFHRFNNILEDGYVEELAYKSMNGQITDGLSLLRTLQLENMFSVEKLLGTTKTAVSRLKALESILLCFAKYGKVKYDPDIDTQRNFEPLVEMRRVADTVNRLVCEDDAVVREQAKIRCFIELWPFYEAALEEDADAAEGLGGSSAMPEGSTRSRARRVVGIMKEDGAGKSPDARRSVGGTSTAENSEFEPVPDNGNDAPEIDFEKIEAELASLESRIMADKRDAMLQEAAERELLDNIGEETHSISGRVPTTLEMSMPPISGPDVKRFESKEVELNLIARSMAKRCGFLRQIDEEAATVNGLFSGKRFKAERVVRNDYRYFSRETVSEPSSSPAILILVDESASMETFAGERSRIDYARDAAYILYRFCELIGAPCCVMGHTATYGIVDLKMQLYADFGRISKSDKYRILSLSARQDNRDGEAIRYAGAHLLAQPNETKLLFSISDGEPQATNYDGAIGINDTAVAVAELRKKGVKVFSAAIGSNKDAIQRIYQEGFLDISDINNLPAMMFSVLRRYTTKR